jgi:hypothetical protein
MIVIVDVFSQQPIEMPLIERDCMIEKLAPEYSDYPLSEWILPWASVACPHGFYSDGSQEQLKVHASKYRIIVVDEVFRLLAKWRCFTYLLECPSCGRMCGHGYMLYLSAVVAYDHKYVKNLEYKRGHSEEINCVSIVHVVSQECLPGLTRFVAGRPADLRDIFGDSVGAGDVRDSEADKLMVNAFRAPKWVFIMYAFDESNSCP